jgi:4'-phosphopantetheinyl transferase EntD
MSLHPQPITPVPEQTARVATLAALFDKRVVVAVASPSLEPGGLYREEVEHVANAVPARRAEFLTARVLARQALEQLGFAPTALVPYPDRTPR